MPAKLIQEKYVSALPGTLVANTLYYVRVGTGFDVYLTNATGTVVAYGMNAKVVPPEPSTGMAVAFDKNRNYGYPTAESGSAFSTDNSTSVLGSIAMIRLNRATEPTYPGSWVCISGKFKASVNNYYYVECVYVAGTAGANNVYHYTLSQTPA